MNPRIRFAALALIFAAIFYGVLRQFTTSWLAMWAFGDATAAIAVMLAAQGFSWRRRLLFAALTVAVSLVMFEVVAHSFLGGAADAMTNMDIAYPSNAQLAAFVAVQVLFTGVPLAALALFVGRRPSRLWSNAQ